MKLDQNQLESVTSGIMSGPVLRCTADNTDAGKPSPTMQLAAFAPAAPKSAVAAFQPQRPSLS